MGIDRAPACRIAVLVVEVARLPASGDRPAAPGRGSGPGDAGAGRPDPVVAVRPNGHRLPTRQRSAHTAEFVYDLTNTRHAQAVVLDWCSAPTTTCVHNSAATMTPIDTRTSGPHPGSR